jgi:hypothetical protein
VKIFNKVHWKSVFWSKIWDFWTKVEKVRENRGDTAHGISLYTLKALEKLSNSILLVHCLIIWKYLFRVIVSQKLTLIGIIMFFNNVRSIPINQSDTDKNMYADKLMLFRTDFIDSTISLYFVNTSSKTCMQTNSYSSGQTLYLAQFHYILSIHRQKHVCRQTHTLQDRLYI